MPSLQYGNADRMPVLQGTYAREEFGAILGLVYSALFHNLARSLEQINK